MAKRLTPEVISTIHRLRRRGFSLNEIKQNVPAGYGTIFRYIKGVKIDPKYKEAHQAGFPDMKGHPAFTYSDATLRRKYDVQEEATMIMASNVAEVLDIPWQELGKFVMSKAVTLGYQAKVTSVK